MKMKLRGEIRCEEEEGRGKTRPEIISSRSERNKERKGEEDSLGLGRIVDKNVGVSVDEVEPWERKKS